MPGRAETASRRNPSPDVSRQGVAVLGWVLLRLDSEVESVWLEIRPGPPSFRALQNHRSSNHEPKPRPFLHPDRRIGRRP